jgi:hypothetical protein
VKRVIILMSLMLCGFAAGAQQPKPQTPPALSEVEQLRVQNLQLRINDINRDVSDFMRQFEATHPGWTINVMSGQLLPKGPAPEAAKPEPEKAPEKAPAKQ